MTGSGSTINVKVKDTASTQTKNRMKGNGRTVSSMVVASTHIQVATCTMGFGKMASDTAKELYSTQKAIGTKATG